MTGQVSFIDFVIAACAVWRVSHLIAYEDGPADIIVRLRNRLGQSFAGNLMDCFQCVSLWAAAPALFIHAPWFVRILAWFGISGAACLLQRIGAGKNFGGTKDVMLWRQESSPETEPDRTARR